MDLWPQRKEEDEEEHVNGRRGHFRRHARHLFGSNDLYRLPGL